LRVTLGGVRTEFIDKAVSPIVAKTDFAARVAVVRAERRMRAELLRSVGRPPPGLGIGLRIDRTA
jgi:hypothetical protein